VILLSGSAFLQDLHRRALGDGRLHLIETAAVAALAGGFSGLKIDVWGMLTFGSWGSGLLSAAIATALWIVLGALLYRVSQAAYRRYIATLLVDTGLLYLVLEHDSHEALKPLKRRELWTQLKLSTGSELSFRGRVLCFLRTYAPCADALGFHPYPALWRNIGRWLDYALLLGGAAFGFVVYVAVINALAYYTVGTPLLKPLGGFVLLLPLCRATLGMARRSGLWLALVDVLIGEVDLGRPLLARR